jgi:hypothetical protein
VQNGPTNLRHSEGFVSRAHRVGPRATGWLEDELLAWQEQRIAEREAGTAVRSLTLRPSASPPRRSTNKQEKDRQERRHKSNR